MKKTVLTFGLISGLIISVLMGGSLLLADKIGSGHSMALGYTIMVASFLLIYFGIRSYRDNTLGRPNLLRPRLRLRHPDHPHHHRLLRRHVGGPLLQLHAPLHGQLLRRADSQGPVLRT